MKEILFSIICAGGLLLPTAIYKQWWLFLVFLTFFICFGLIEFLAVKFSGHSVSQNFWIFSQANFKGGIIVLVCMLVSWVSLLIHLGYKMFLK